MKSTDPPTWHDVSDRYHGQLAPSGLHLTQALANSVARTEDDVDPLAGDLPAAQAWIDVLVAEWDNVHGSGTPTVTLTDRGLDRVRKLRATVHEVLLGDPGAKLSAPVDVTVAGGRVALVPRGTDARWLESAVSAELLLAERDDTRRRLKLCRNPRCHTAFYDQSKNNSKVWHDTAMCGTPMHMREYRKRRQERPGQAERERPDPERSPVRPS